LHEMELLGKAKVRVRDERVVESGEPLIEWCPLFDKVRGIKRVTSEEAAKNMQFRIDQHGMFTSRRKLEMDTFVGFGASESMMTGVTKGIIDAAVTVCDGAGTVITDSPSLIQGMGGWISGLTKTEPIPEIIAGIEARGGHVLSPQDAKIDQYAGAIWASKSFSHYAVTITDVVTVKKLRSFEADSGVKILIIGVHLTSISRKDAKTILSMADIVTGCASKHIRELVTPLVQVGTAIPLFGLTRWGKELLIERAKDVEQQLLINTMSLPVLPEHKQPKPLV
jgi:putative methanogenesis marker protein 8